MASETHGTRAALLTAARARFATVGFDACRLTDLCADAALTTGALYRNFASKEAVLATLLTDLDADLAAIDATELAAVAASWLDIARRHRGAFRVSVEQSLTNGPMAAVRRDQRDTLVARLRSALPDHRLTDVAAAVAADALEYVVLAETLGWTPARPSRAVANGLDQLLRHGVYGDDTTPRKASTRRASRRGMAPVLSWSPGPGRAHPTSRRGTEQVEAVLAAANAAFEELGLARTTVSDIARRASVSSGTVYRYFTDKIDVLACLLVRVEQNLYATAVLPTDERGRFDPFDATLAYLATHRRHVGVFRAWREVAVAGGPLAEAWVSMHREFARGIEGVVADGQRRGIARTDLDPALVGELTVAMFEQSAHTRHELGWDDDVGDIDAAGVISAVLGVGLDTEVR